MNLLSFIRQRPAPVVGARKVSFMTKDDVTGWQCRRCKTTDHRKCYQTERSAVGVYCIDCAIKRAVKHRQDQLKKKGLK